MKESDILRFSLTVFDYSEILNVKEVIKDLFETDFLSGSASLTENDFDISKFYAPTYDYHIEEVACFWKTESYPNKIFFTASIIDGWYTLCNVLHRRLHCGFVQCLFSNERDSQGYSFHYGGADGRERDVLAYKDPRWVFYEEGDPLDFEDLNLYKSRLVRDRLNSKILIEYLKRMGIDFEKIDMGITESFTFVRKIPHDEA